MATRKFLIGFACACLVFALVTGCPDPFVSPLPDSPFYPTNSYAYVVNNQATQCFVSATNQSLDWGMDLIVTFRDMTGAVVSTFQKRLNTGASHRLSPPAGFEGSVIVEGVGAQYSLASQVELRAPNAQGAAMATASYHEVIISHLYWPSVIDTASGPVQSKVATLNLHEDIPLYIEFDHLAGDCADTFESKVEPWAVHTFRPAQEFHGAVSQGICDFIVYSAGNTGPNRTGTQDGAFDSTIFATNTQGSMALDNYADVWPFSWPPWPNNGSPDLYAADVQDDGVNRADRLYVKVDQGTSYGGATYQNYNVHFYDENGGKTTKQIYLANNMEFAGSCGIVKPMELLGKAFKGSVRLEAQTDAMQLAVRRIAPGKWVDLSTGGPVGGYRTCVVPYVTSKDSQWKYEIVVFYPESIYPPPDPLSEPPAPVTYGGPPVPAPPAGERVVLKFYDFGGKYHGWVALYMQKNQTKRITLTQVSNYLQWPIEGSVHIEPFVAVEVQLSHVNGQAHGSMNPWVTGQL